MPKIELLPGVTSSECPPVVVCNSRRMIVRARRRAALYDVMQLALILAVDFLFLHWPSTHVPLLDRKTSVIVLLAANSVAITSACLSRLVPPWSARRTASTWCAAERRRFTMPTWRRER